MVEKRLKIMKNMLRNSEREKSMNYLLIMHFFLVISKRNYYGLQVQLDYFSLHCILWLEEE